MLCNAIGLGNFVGKMKNTENKLLKCTKKKCRKIKKNAEKKIEKINRECIMYRVENLKNRIVTMAEVDLI